MTVRFGGQEDYLYPNKDIPTPLPENFYKDWLETDSTRPSSQGLMNERNGVSQSARPISPVTEAIVEQLMRENQELIEREALKQVAAAAVNVNAAQYSNLIPLSFDQEDFIRQEEERRMKQREKLQSALRLKKPAMLDKFSSLASALSQLQGALKKSAIQSGHEDHGALLRSHVLVPQRLQLEPDAQLQALTSYRVHSWNHDVVPDYLRTKLNPDMESEELLLEQDRNQKGQDVISKQITHLNKYVDLLLQSLHSSDRAHNENLTEKATYNKEETIRLVRATMVGEGLKVNLGRSTSATSSAHSTAQVIFDVDYTNPSYLCSSSSDHVSCVELGGLGERKCLTVLLPWIQVAVCCGFDFSLSDLKTELFDKLKRMAVSQFSMKATDYVFQALRESTGEMEELYNEEPYPILSLFEPESFRHERDLAQVIGQVLGYSLDDLEMELTDEMKTCRAALFKDTCDAVNTRGSEGYSHYAFPEGVILDVAQPCPHALIAKIKC
ncbi:unnamed protein product [Angiostrongylus costaricensis]|uniref:Mediator of RNA polymerase II transcription subunit 8 n=1 Tax=Angiostrongylus costaricensis TaxID=334426 RepID=A0A0R3PA65_ANGCS|nr:unnamed protein product [Angiostrongylus costaricensis]